MKTMMKRFLVSIGICAACVAIAGIQHPVRAQAPGLVVDHRVLHWSGDVDDTVIVYMHMRDVRTETVKGKPTENVNADPMGRVPDRPSVVALDAWDGRGDVHIEEQPSPRNNFTAAIRIHDPQGGRGHYSFTLSCQPIDVDH